MRKAVVVIGAGYGDEGKGLMTDYFTRTYNSPLTIRFNGGAQAGHTVVGPVEVRRYDASEGMVVVKGQTERHVFSHFGSGSFNRADTFLSEHFIVNPLLFNSELQTLKRKIPQFNQRVLVDPECLVTTPIDMLINQALEYARGSGRHGSCGVGINETVHRNSTPGKLGRQVSLRVEDLLNWDFADRISKIATEYMPVRCEELNVEPPQIDLEQLINKFQIEVIQFLDNVRVVRPRSDYFSRFYDQNETTFVFEGAQGLRLDQNAPDFPHVTRSNTGCQNVFDLTDLGFDELEICYVTRAYLTRHGAGPLPFECPPTEISPLIEEKTNVTNKHQGAFRYAPLSKFVLRSFIEKDLRQCRMYYNSRKLKVSSSLAITCLDHLKRGDKTIPLVEGGGVVWNTREEFFHKLGSITDKMYGSFGPTAGDVVKISLS